MAADVRAGLRDAALLPVGDWEVSLVGGVSRTWGGVDGAFARGELGWHPVSPLTVYGFGQVDVVGVSAGAGARVTW